METIVLILGIAMVAPLPFEEVVSGYGRLALAVLGFLLIFWWLFKNDQKKFDVLALMHDATDLDGVRGDLIEDGVRVYQYGTQPR